jgi:hypothetical protein
MGFEFSASAPLVRTARRGFRLAKVGLSVLAAAPLILIAVPVTPVAAAGYDQQPYVYDGSTTIASPYSIAHAGVETPAASALPGTSGFIYDPSAYLVATNTPIRRPGPGTPHVDDSSTGFEDEPGPTSRMRRSRLDRIGNGAAMGLWGAARGTGTTRRLRSRFTQTSATGDRSDPTTTIGPPMARGTDGSRMARWRSSDGFAGGRFAVVGWRADGVRSWASRA